MPPIKEESSCREEDHHRNLQLLKLQRMTDRGVSSPSVTQLPLHLRLREHSKKWTEIIKEPEDQETFSKIMYPTNKLEAIRTMPQHYAYLNKIRTVTAPIGMLMWSHEISSVPKARVDSV